VNQLKRENVSNLSGEDLIVVRVDGGICSQIAFCSLGLHLQKRGYRVKYDLSFYKDNGLDSEGRFQRCWDMPRAFPALQFESATEAEIAAVKGFATRRSELMTSWRPPLYVGGYPDCSSALLEMLPLLRENFKPEMLEGMERRLHAMHAACSCAVHVRRGDLAHGNPAYGVATSTEYYRQSMAIVAGLYPGTSFFFFSDEPDWVRENVLPIVPDGCESHLVDDNGSDRGYLDLYMISQCECVISSIGSLGVYGALLSPASPTLVLSRFSVLAVKSKMNTIYLIRDGNGGFEPTRADAISRAIPERKLHGLWHWVYRVWRKLGLLLSDGTIRIEMFPAR